MKFAYLVMLCAAWNGGGCVVDSADDGARGSGVADGAGGAIDLPEPVGPPQPMTCEWLDGANCWTSQYDAANACAPEAAGTFDEERTTCVFPDGSAVEFDAPITDSGTFYIDHRLRSADGSVCFRVDTLGWAKGAVTTPGGTAITENVDFNTRITCPDGSAFDTGVEGTCEGAEARLWNKQIPGYSFECDADRGVCEGIFWAAADTQPQVLFTCK